MFEEIWRAICNFFRWLFGGGPKELADPPTIKPVFYSSTTRIDRGLTFLVEGAGAAPTWGPIVASLDINGTGTGPVAMNRGRKRKLNANDWFVQTSFTGMPTAPAGDGGGVGSITITVNGVNGTHDIGYGDPPPGAGEPPPFDAARKKSAMAAAAITVKPVLRFSVPTATGMTVLIEGCDSPPDVSAALDVTVGATTTHLPNLSCSGLRLYSHLTPDGYFCHIDFSAGGPAGDGVGKLTVTVTVNGVSVDRDILVGYGDP